MNAEHRSLLFHCSYRWFSLGKSFIKRVYKLVDKILQQENSNLADCLAENKFLLKLAYLYHIFAKLNKLNIFMQGPDKNMLDVSDKIAAFIKKLSLWKKDIKNVSGSSQYFIFLSSFLEKKSMMLPSNLRSVFAQHLSNRKLKFKKYFPENLCSYEWIRDPFAQPTPSSFTEQEKENYLDLTYDNSLKRKFYLVNLTNFWISVNDEYPALTKKALRMIIPFASSYLCEPGFFAMAVIRSKYTCKSRIIVEREIWVAVLKIFPRFEELCKNKQAYTSH